MPANRIDLRLYTGVFNMDVPFTIQIYKESNPVTNFMLDYSKWLHQCRFARLDEDNQYCVTASLLINRVL